MYFSPWSIFGILIAVTVSEPYRILVIFPFPITSHSILGEAFVNELLKAGHHVTYITPYPITEIHTNLSQVKLTPHSYKGMNLKTFVEEGGDKRGFGEIFSGTLNVTYAVLLDKNMQIFMEDPDPHFDVVVTEWMNNDVYCGFSALFNCPYIWLFPYENPYEISRHIHEFPSPVGTDTSISLLSVIQLAKEFLYRVVFAVKRTFYSRDEAKAYEYFFGPALAKKGRTLPPYEIMRYNASLMFSNSHVNIRARPSMPANFKAIGGFHISPNLEPLSEDLLRIIESAENGVILFSTGTHLKADDMSHKLKRDLLSMFATLNYTVLWKINEQFDDIPTNVKTSSWIPNRSILAHPKCVLLITHGGMLSLMESVHYGIPIIGLPVFADQGANVQTAVNLGIAKMVTMSSVMVPNLKEAVDQLLSSPRYKERAKELLYIYHDRPVPPGQELVHWVEHVVATRGAPHLRSPALLVPWYQECYLDLFAIILVLFMILMLTLKTLYAYVMIWINKCEIMNVGRIKIKKRL